LSSARLHAFFAVLQTRNSVIGWTSQSENRLGLAPFWVVRIIIHGMFIIVEEATPDTDLPPLLGNSMEPIQRPAVRAMLRDHLDYDRLELAMRPAPRNRDVEVVILFPLQATVDGLVARIGAWAIRA